MKLKNNSIGVSHTQRYAILLSFLILIFSSSLVFAEGDGSGGGQGEPLALLSSSPANGSSDVDVSSNIVLGFSKNVINMTVKDNNMTCFALFDSKGDPVSIKVIMADDQMEPEKKREVIVDPVSGLMPSTKYTLEISAAMQAKSGVTLPDKVTVSFTTATVKPAVSEPLADSTKPAAAETQTIEKYEASANPAGEPADSSESQEQGIAGMESIAGGGDSNDDSETALGSDENKGVGIGTDSDSDTTDPAALERSDAVGIDNSTGKTIIILSAIVIALLAAYLIIRKLRRK